MPGGLVASQKPSESRLLMAIGGRMDTRHCPRGHFLTYASLQWECTYIGHRKQVRATGELGFLQLSRLPGA